MSEPKSFEDLDVWKKSVDLALSVYQASGVWPKEERFGITRHIRRAATSVAANIAEGAERDGTREFLRFLSIANSSLAETKTFLVFAERLKYNCASRSGVAKRAIDRNQAHACRTFAFSTFSTRMS